VGVRCQHQKNQGDKVKKKTAQVISFIENMHEFVTGNPQFRRDTRTKTETQIQTELRPLLIRYLEKHFNKKGVKDYTAKAIKSFYWEGQEGQYGKLRATTFGSRNYPDFIITAPYLLAVEYKQSATGSSIKQGIGQSVMHTLCGDFDFVYYLFHDQSKDKRIQNSITDPTEAMIIEKMWQDFNVYIRFV
jgi:hypothetical protein